MLSPVCFLESESPREASLKENVFTTICFCYVVTHHYIAVSCSSSCAGKEGVVCGGCVVLGVVSRN